MKTISELPVAVLRRPHESSPSLLVRAAAANGLRVPELLRLLGGVNRRDIDVRHSRLWMDLAGPRDCNSFGGVGDSVHYLGQPFWPLYLLRLKRPQVCVRCLEQVGYCQEVWELSCFTACPAHRCTLVDTCPSCGRGLRWFRPSLEVCGCGAFVSDRSGSCAEDDAICVASEISERVAGGPTPRVTAPSAQFAWWRSISLNCFMQILVAFGAQTSSKPPASGPLHRMSTQGWAALVSRGLKRLRTLAATNVGNLSFEALAEVVWEGALESLASRPVLPADRDAALALIQAALRSAAGGRQWRYQKGGRQLELFGGAHEPA